MPALRSIEFQDSQAPYKGVWVFEDQGRAGLFAYHATFYHDQRTGCVIEQRAFDSSSQARRFARHLLLHGWSFGSVSSETSTALSGILSPDPVA
ncbi:MAG: hypothetical protein FJ077_08605 [Cyanobacteria bacterium K_DeepCast_35m_m2_023]|nr:hypothetical protein [Cyanobacteria bacterium K_DeepCast_35m_m2_023]